MTKIDTGSIVKSIMKDKNPPNKDTVKISDDVRRLNDMRTFPKITGLKNKTFLPCGFNNKVCLFYSPDDLEEKTGYKLLTYLKGKFITYSFTLERGDDDVSWYFGHTGDIGERLTTHDKDARNGERRFYKDLNKVGRALFTVWGVFDNPEDAKSLESELITRFKDAICRETTGYGLSKWKLKEANDIVKDYIYNINNK